MFYCDQSKYIVSACEKFFVNFPFENFFDMPLEKCMSNINLKTMRNTM